MNTQEDDAVLNKASLDASSGKLVLVEDANGILWKLDSWAQATCLTGAGTGVGCDMYCIPLPIKVIDLDPPPPPLPEEIQESREYVETLLDTARLAVREAIFEAARFRHRIDDLVPLEKELLKALRERKRL